ncbi:MAG: carboxymuconolactone decarboxylase family protein [Gemmatimonadota bacterium]
MSAPAQPGGGLAAGERLLVRLAAAVADPGAEALREAARAVAAAGLHAAGEEVLLQSHLFAGYPAALEAFAAWREVAGPTVHAPDEALPPPQLRARGEKVCRVVYGTQYVPLRANVAALHPALERWMLEEGYGRVLGRPGLPLRVRELCIVALTAGLVAPRQLYSHLRGALHAGATAAQVEDTLAEAAGVQGHERAAAAAALWRAVRERSGPRPTAGTQDGGND